MRIRTPTSLSVTTHSNMDPMWHYVMKPLRSKARMQVTTHQDVDQYYHQDLTDEQTDSDEERQ